MLLEAAMCWGKGEQLQQPPLLTALKKWPATKIPVIIDAGFHKLAKRNIRDAMDHIMEYSCLKFKEENRRRQPVIYVEFEDSSDVGYVSLEDEHRRRQPAIYIAPGKDGCSSDLGYTPNVGSSVSLEDPGCTSMPTVAHELMHALGFDHEHKRYDRDQHVSTCWSLEH